MISPPGQSYTAVFPQVVVRLMDKLHSASLTFIGVCRLRARLAAPRSLPTPEEHV